MQSVPDVCAAGSLSAIECLEENGDDLVATDAAVAAAPYNANATQTNARFPAAWARFVQDFKSVSVLGALAAFAAGFFGGVLGGLTGPDGTAGAFSTALISPPNPSDASLKQSLPGHPASSSLLLRS